MVVVRGFSNLTSNRKLPCFTRFQCPAQLANREIKNKKGESFGVIVLTYRIILVQKVNVSSRKESVIGLDVERLVSREVQL